MSNPNGQEIIDKLAEALVTMQNSLRNMEKLNVNPNFRQKFADHYRELIKISDHINRLIKENPEVIHITKSTAGPRKI